MRPVLFELFGVSFPAYGVFFALGFLAGFTWGYFECERVGIKGEKGLDVGFWLFVFSVIGARVAYVIVDWEYLKGDPLEAFRIWNGGLVLYGGIFGGIVGSYISIKVMSLPLGKTADVIMPCVALGLILGRVGCLLNGCCYGRPADLPWGISYFRGDSIARAVLGIELHPTPVYSMLFLLALFLFLVWLTRRKRFDGQVFWSFYILYPAGRFFIEFFRGDPRGWVEEPVFSRIFAPLLTEQAFSDPTKPGFFHMPYLSTSQYISIFTFIAAVAGYLYTRRRVKAGEIQENDANLHSRD